jgi:hypothetical protein
MTFLFHVVQGAFLGIDTGTPKVDAAIVTGLVTLVSLVLRGVGLVISGQQARQRDLFSKAYEAAMGWNEMLYRIRRRADGDEADRALVERFHELQEQIDYYEGWTASEGRFIGKSYCRLVLRR